MMMIIILSLQLSDDIYLIDEEITNLTNMLPWMQHIHVCLMYLKDCLPMVFLDSLMLFRNDESNYTKTTTTVSISKHYYRIVTKEIISYFIILYMKEIVWLAI